MRTGYCNAKTTELIDSQENIIRKEKPVRIITEKDSHDLLLDTIDSLSKGDELVVTTVAVLGTTIAQLNRVFANSDRKGVTIKILDLDNGREDDLKYIVTYLCKSLSGTKKVGKPRIEIPDNFLNVAEDYQKGGIPLKAALDRTGLTRRTFFRLKKNLLNK